MNISVQAQPRLGASKENNSLGRSPLMLNEIPEELNEDHNGPSIAA